MMAEINNALTHSSTVLKDTVTNKVKSSWVKMAGKKINCFSQWVNPKNWFSSLTKFDISMDEFACKKTGKNEQK